MFELMVALALVIANGFFVASEFALVRLRLTEATEMEGAGRAGARSARHAVEHLDAYLAACQLGITLASIGLGVVGKPAFEALLHPIFAGSASIAGFGVAAALAFLIITLLHVVVGELAPKQLSTPTHAAKLALKSLADRVSALDREIAVLDTQLQQLVTTTAPRTTSLLGIKTGHAGQFLVTARGLPPVWRTLDRWGRKALARRFTCRERGRHFRWSSVVRH